MTTQASLPLDAASLAYASALDLAKLIREKKISSEELTRLYLERLEKYGAQLGAVVTLMADQALAQARQADDELARGKRRSALHGVPYGVKDLFATKNAPTTWGSPVYKERIIPADAHVVVNLREAGCPLLGKLAMVEFAGCVGYRYATASITGAGRTPWNLEHWSGGSSSGSGAAAAAGLVGFAIGTETWGSILCPSAFCGATGLRPTAGRVSRAGAMALSWTMDKIGPIARSVADTAQILEIISGDDGGSDLGLRPAQESVFQVPSAHPRVKGLRLGVVRPDYGKDPGVQPETEAAFAEALAALQRLGVETKDVTLPDLPTDEAAGTIVVAEAASAFEDVARDSAKLKLVVDPETRGGLVANLALPAVDYIRSLRVRALAQQTLPTVFSDIDALVAPSYLVVAPPITANLDTAFPGSDNKISGLGNMLGLPALGVPMGFGPGHLPLGLQFVGAPLTEDILLALGAAYQSATDWHAQRPPLFL